MYSSRNGLLIAAGFGLFLVVKSAAWLGNVTGDEAGARSSFDRDAQIEAIISGEKTGGEGGNT